MKFIECYIESFGKLRSFKYSFRDGLNSIIAENGYGKTTLSVFIKCMLYGMEDTKKQGLEENDRKHYIPWQGGRCGGYLSLEIAGKRYRIERSFSTKASEDTFALYDLETGKESNDFGADLGIGALGIDRDGFERTVFLSERNLWGKNDNPSISAKLSDLVGCDGDIGGFDTAFDLLEAKRKYYFKNGGKGAIGDLNAKISECDLEIANVERQRENMAETERELFNTREVCRALEMKKASLEEDKKELLNLRSRSQLAESYSENLTALARDRARLDELKARFGESIPSSEEIDNAGYKLREADKLASTAAMYGENREYAKLSERFFGKTDIAEIEKMAATEQRLSEKKASLCEISSTLHERSKYFSKRLPGEAELFLKSQEAKKGSALPFVLGVLGLACGLILLFVFAYAGAAVIAASLVFTVIAGIISSKRSSAIYAFLSEISDEPLPKRSELGSYIAFLIEKRGEEEALLRSADTNEKRRELLNAEIAECEREISEFLTRMSADGTESPADEIRRIREDFIRYYKMTISAEQGAVNKHDAIERATRLRREAEEFIDRFDLSGESPLTELKNMLLEYNHLCSSVEEKARLCESQKERYGFEAGVEIFSPEKLASVEAAISICDETLAKKRRDCASLETSLGLLEESCERGSILTAERARLAEELDYFQKRLDIIRKTKKYLAAAKDSMTAKYLGKTRAGFEKYRALIDGEDSEREFTLDTSFALTVTEGGATHQHGAYSKGTRELYALATRLALSDSLYDGELPPLILDDPFASLDDRRLAMAQRLVRDLATDRQIIYFSCQKSRNVT